VTVNRSSGYHEREKIQNYELQIDCFSRETVVYTAKALEMISCALLLTDENRENGNSAVPGTVYQIFN
jgi:hypothetical protein